MSRTVLTLITLLALASHVSRLDAAVIGPGPCSAASWGQPSGGQYHVDKNWIRGTAPCLGGEKDFSIPDTYTVEFDETAFSATRPIDLGPTAVRAGRVTFDLGAPPQFDPDDPYNFDVTYQFDNLQLGPVSGDRATLAIVGNTSAINSFSIGAAGNTTSNLILSNTGTVFGSFVFGNSLILGENGRGSLTLNQGTHARFSRTVGPLLLGESSQASGSLTVADAGTRLLLQDDVFLGVEGSGAAVIRDGAIVEASNQLIMGLFANSSGSIVVEGSGVLNGETVRSQLIGNPAVSVGGSGTGEFIVRDGALAEVSNVVLGQFAQGNMRIESNGEVRSSGVVTVGESDLGTLTLSTGGLLQSPGGLMIIGNNTGSTGQVTVEGSTLRMGEILVGNDGNGVLRLTGNGEVDAGTVIIGANGTGIVENSSIIDANTLRVAGSLELSLGSEASVRSARIGGFTTPQASQAVARVSIADAGTLWGGTFLTIGGDSGLTPGLFEIRGGAVISNVNIGETGILAQNGGELFSQALVDDGQYFFSGGRASIGNYFGDFEQLGGVLDVGSSMSIHGDYQQVAGLLEADFGRSRIEILSDKSGNDGTVRLGGGQLDLNLLFEPIIGETMTLIDNDGTDAIVGNFLGLFERAIFSETYLGKIFDFEISYVGGTGNDVVITVLAANAVPLPAAFWLFGSAFIAIFGYMKKKPQA